MSVKPSTRRDGSGSKPSSAAVITSVVIFAACCLAPAYGADPIGFSGYEVSPGSSSSGDIVRNVLFAGSTNTPCNCFTSQSDGGTWIATVDRTAGGGLGGSSTLLRGRLTVDRDDVVTSYRITGGYVIWPSTLDTDIGCGPGVANVQITLSRGRTVTGCLDDTHLDPFKQPFVFPPHIWGTLR
jgi:hypothetical protein